MLDTIRLHVNGREQTVRVDRSESLLIVLRERLDLTGSKYGCGEGRCGACTVLVDGEPARSCTTAVSSAIGRRVVTIEGLASDEALHPLQEAFLEEDALQCGYCTSGMIVSAAGLLRQNPDPNRREIIEFMYGNVCRCGVYGRIVAAVGRAAGKMKETRR